MIRKDDMIIPWLSELGYHRQHQALRTRRSSTVVSSRPGVHRQEVEWKTSSAIEIRLLGARKFFFHDIRVTEAEDQTFTLSWGNLVNLG